MRSPVGANSFAKRPVHPKHVHRLQHCLRKQACSHRFGVLPDLPSLELAQAPWERACSRRGRYIRCILTGCNIVFAKTLAPTGFAYFRTYRALSWRRPRGSELAREEAITFDAFSSAATLPSQASLPTGLAYFRTYRALSWRRPRGSELAREGAGTCAAFDRLQHCLRKQACSHRLGVR